MSAFEQQSWSPDYIKKFGRAERERVFRHLTKDALGDRVCRGERHTAHSIKFGLDPKKAAPLSKLKALVTMEETRMFFEKRAIVAKIFGNEYLALNPLYAECPISGQVVGLGKFNNFGTPANKLVDHIEVNHSSDPNKGTHLGFTKFFFSSPSCRPLSPSAKFPFKKSC